MSVELAEGKYQLLPPLPDEQFQRLKESIRLNGVLVPIEFDEDGKILDGHHRFRAFAELMQEPADTRPDLQMFPKVTKKGWTEQQKQDYVVTVNVDRRHLTTEDRAQMFKNLRVKYGFTLQRIADLSHVSVATVSRDLNEKLTDEELEQVKNATVVAKDGRTNAGGLGVAKTTFSTGESQMKQAQAHSQPAAQQEIATQFLIVITCDGEEQQTELLNELLERGLDVRALVS